MNNGITLTEDDFYYVEKNVVCIDFSKDEKDKDRSKELKQQILNNQVIIKAINKLVEEKEGWLRINTYRITEHQKSLVENEVKELQDILDTTYHSDSSGDES